MASMIKGIPVTLYRKTQTGTDPFGAPIWAEEAVTVDNVLVTPTASREMVDSTQLQGKRAEYELCIPKTDTNDWEDSRVAFFGAVWQTIGPVTQYIPDLVPLAWNKKIKVAKYD